MASSLAQPQIKLITPGLIQSPSLSVVVVNYRSWDQTTRLIQQLREGQDDSELIVVDNDSTGADLEDVVLCRSEANLGFARAVNAAWKQSRGRWLLLLNPDVSVAPAFLRQVQNLTLHLEMTEPKVGIVGLAARNSDGSFQPTAGPMPRFTSTIARLLLPRSRRKYYLSRPSHRQNVDWVSGCALLVREECLAQLGGVSTDYFLYYEDVDLCLRAQQSGWLVQHEPGINVTHHSPIASRSVSPTLRVFTRHALMTFAWKYWSTWQAKMICRLVQWEARARRWRADDSARATFVRLEEIARLMKRNQPQSARRILDALVESVSNRGGENRVDRLRGDFAQRSGR